MVSIILKSVSIDFPIYNVHARSFKKELLKLTTGGILKQKERTCVVIKALDNISFSLNHGDRLGLIGHNGAGKSTLLKTLAKIYEPTAGSMHFDGHVVPLFDLTLGFNQESTGYENIVLRALTLGMSRKEIKAKMDEIVAFTELGHFLDMPIRTYSAGMQLRLAFAVTLNMKPEILLMDELIGVGDARFMEKSQAQISQLLDSSSIIILASHSESVIKQVCNKAVLLEHGKMKYFGDVTTAFDIYHGRS